MRYSLLSAALASAFVVPQDLNVFEQARLALSRVEQALKVTPYDELPLVDTEALQELITVDALNASAIELFDVANASVSEYGHPTRVIGSAGHWKTLSWIEEQLDELSDYYTYHTQEFDALYGKIYNYSLSVNQVKVDSAQAFQLSPAAHVYWANLFVAKNFGCDAADYEGIDPINSVALIKRGTCAFGNKSDAAGAAGAKSAIIYDPESDEAFCGTLGAPLNNTVGTLGVPRSVANDLIARLATGEPLKINLFIAGFVGIVKTKNIIADTIHGDPENVISLGAHSDSVAAGPGINDDGSGTISLLTVAKELTNFKINNAVRFAWWAAEEEGLLGSNFYAYNLTAEENSKIRLFMDYDMMASPNYEYQVYNGSNAVNPAGSEELKNLYIDFYESKDLPWVLTEFDGRSDYVGFIENGIPAGGIAAGAEGLNSVNGGVLDQCYHQLCDDLTNIAWDAFLVDTQLIAHSVATYAESLEGFPERETTKAFEASDASKKFARNGDFYIM